MYKVAEEEEGSEAYQKALLGTSTAVIGGNHVKKQFDKGRLTGRERLYKLVDDAKVKDILEQGDPTIGGYSKTKKKALEGTNIFNRLSRDIVEAKVPVWKNEINISASHFVDSPVYQRAGRQEIADFVKSNPKRFAKGMAHAGAGALVAGIGAKLTADAWNERESKNK